MKEENYENMMNTNCRFKYIKYSYKLGVNFWNHKHTRIELQIDFCCKLQSEILKVHLKKFEFVTRVNVIKYVSLF